jgi:putative ABC transport system permease protein
MESVLHILRVAIRSLGRTPGFVLIAVLTLALGIGLSTAVFTVANAVILRRIPVQEQDRLVIIAGETRDQQIRNYPIGLEDARDFARTARSLARVAFFAYEGAAPNTIRDAVGNPRLRRSLVSGDFFAVLGVRPVLGRALRSEDDITGAAPVMVLSHRAWHQRFGGAADAIGRQILMQESGLSYTVVGVMPEGLDYPQGTDAWAPILSSAPKQNLPFVAVDLIGRLAPNASPNDARDEATAFLARDDHPAWEQELHGTAHTLPELVLGDTRPALLAVSVAAALLLLITCVNVANLLLVRGLARTREVAVRTALGATRGRIIAQLLIEHGLLAIAGGALGLALAAVAVRGFLIFAPPGLPRLGEIHVDVSVLAGAIGITGLAMLIFGVAPALATSRVDVQRTLASGTGQTASRVARLTAESLVAGQVALALLVLSAAALVTRSLIKLERADLAFDSSGLLIGELALRYDRYDTAPKQAALLERLLPHVRAIPGVVAVSPVVAPPFAAAAWDGNPGPEGQSVAEAAHNPMLNMEVVGPGYFTALGIPILRGRGFTDADRSGAPPVVMLSETAVRHYWPGSDPLGKRLTMEPGSNEHTFTVVGVVPDTRYRDLREARASIYFPLSQSFFPFTPTALAVRTSVAPARMVPALRRVLAENAPDVELASATPFDDLLAAPLAQPRLNALLLAVFAIAAVALSAIGLFGVMATMVRQRAREFGVRIALGATAGAVSHLVLRRGMTIVAIGTCVGLLGALALNRLLAAILFGVSPTDTPTLAAVAAMLFIVALVATVVPARASTRVDPVIALRAE